MPGALFVLLNPYICAMVLRFSLSGFYRFLAFAVLLCMQDLQAQDKPAYTLYNAKGKKVSYTRLLKKAAQSDMVLFGELHDNPIAHWLQLELTTDLHTARNLILGAEMIEADNQQALNWYLKDSISAKKLDTLARLWKNYPTDYKPLVDFAKNQKLDFVASNIPRRYASRVFKGGFQALDTLSPREKAWIAPLPIAYDPGLSQYVAMLSMMGGHGGENFPKAQAIKDATMAHFILKHYREGSLFVHYHGAFHSDFYQGILWYLKKEKPLLRYLTISTVTQKNISTLEKEHLGKADFILCVDEDMTRTH